MGSARQDAGVVVVGAGAAGTTAAWSLRSAGYAGPVTVVGAEGREPYNRTAVSKGLLTGDLEAAQVLLPERAAPGVEWLLGDAAAQLDHRGRSVRLQSGRTLPYRALVLATGAGPRTLPAQGAVAARARLLGLHSSHDAEQVRGVATRGRDIEIAVLGAGLVGSETATALAAMGVRVHLVARSPTPMRSTLGLSAASWVVRSHARTLESCSSRGVLAVQPTDGHLALRLGDGTELVVDAAVTCLGTRRATRWLTGTGLDSPDGIVVDPFMRVPAMPGVYAAGDVVRQPRGDEAPWAAGHWSLSVAQARHLAGTVLHDLGAHDAVLEPFRATSSHTTHIHGTKVTVIGNPTAHHREHVVDGDPASDAFTALLIDAGDVVRAIVGVGPALPALRLRQAVGRPVSEAVLPD